MRAKSLLEFIGIIAFSRIPVPSLGISRVEMNKDKSSIFPLPDRLRTRTHTRAHKTKTKRAEFN